MPDLRPRPTDLLRKTLARVRARGAADVLGLLGERVRDAIRSDDVLILLVRDAADERRPKEGLAFREATPGDAERYARAIGTESPATFRRRLTATTRCYVVEAEAGLVHASWVTTAAAWTREVRRYFRPPDGDVYVYESFTRSEARGRGVYPFALREIAARARADGRERVWVGVIADNAPSLRAVSKAGFMEAFRIGYRRRLGRLELAPPQGPLAALAPACFTRSPPKRAKRETGAPKKRRPSGEGGGARERGEP